MTVPVKMPDLIKGAGDSPEDGPCVMQAVAWLATGGAAWTDMPACTHHVLRLIAIWVNDSVDYWTRQQLWPLIPRLIDTATGDQKTDIRTGIALAVWAVERVLSLIKNEERHALAAERIGRARASLAGEDITAAAADAAYAAYAANAAYARSRCYTRMANKLIELLAEA